MSQAELARASGLSAPSVWSLEHGKTKQAKFDTLAAIAAALGVPVQAILAPRQTRDINERITAAIADLSPQNKAALLGAAKALLAAQKK